MDDRRAHATCQQHGEIVSNLDKLPGEVFTSLFGTSDGEDQVEPMMTFKNLWNAHREMPYRLGGILCLILSHGSYPHTPMKVREYRFGAKLTIGSVDYPVTRFQVDYGLNSIPVATVDLAVGFDVRGGKPSPVHAGLATEDPLDSGFPPTGQLFVKIDDHEDTSDFVSIFTGRVNSVGYTHRRGELGLRVQLTSRLANLTYSTCMIATAPPLDTRVLNMTAVTQPDAAGSNQQKSVAAFINANVAAVDGAKTAFMNDVGEGILKILRYVCNQKVFAEGDAKFVWRCLCF